MAFLTPLQIEPVDARHWVLLAPLVFEGRERCERWEIPAGHRTDLATVPGVATPYVPRYGVYTAPAVLHDLHCEIAKGLWPDLPYISRRDADGLFRRNLREAEVSLPRRWCMYAAVRVGGRMEDADAFDWGAVVLTAVLCLPFLLVPVLATGALLALTWLVEALFRLLRIE